MNAGLLGLGDPAGVSLEGHADRDVDDRPEVLSLFENLKTSLPALEWLLESCSSHGGYEDRVYRLYHQSWKLYRVQGVTAAIVAALQALAPGRELNRWFMQIVKDGTGKSFEPEHNERWLEVGRPMIEAYFHARFFLEMGVRHGKTLEAPPRVSPSGWAAFLYLYDLR